ETRFAFVQESAFTSRERPAKIVLDAGKGRCPFPVRPFLERGKRGRPRQRWMPSRSAVLVTEPFAQEVRGKGLVLAMSTDRVPMTREGYEKLKTDLDRMQHVEMLEVAKRIAAARDLGDLSENAEYHAAREDQGMLQARVDALKDKLARAYI